MTLNPRLQSITDLTELSEVYHMKENYTQCKFSFIDDKANAYFGTAPVTKKDLTLESIMASLARIPDEEIYPVRPEGLIVADREKLESEDFYIKRPGLLDYELVSGEDALAQLLLQEGRNLECIRRHPHPSLASYHGCVMKGDRIAGLVLSRFLVTLEDRVHQTEKPLDKEAVMEMVTYGVQHLHTQGLAHNDLNPNNVMLNEQDSPVIIDFGSTKPFGEKLISAGTEGWVEEDFDQSAAKNDEVALRLIREWLDGQLS